MVDLFSLIKDYLVDQEDEIRCLIMWFLNLVMVEEALHVFIDATCLKVIDGPHYKNKALFIVAGVRNVGYREILGVRLADSEDSLFWEDLFNDLKERGLRGVKLIVSDGQKEIQKAVRESFIGSSWQMCHSHLVRLPLKKGIENFTEN